MHSRTIKLNTHNKVALFAVENNCSIQDSQAALDKVQEWVDGNLDRIVDEQEERHAMKQKLLNAQHQLEGGTLEIDDEVINTLHDLSIVLSYVLERLK